jgi:hypothetical protein
VLTPATARQRGLANPDIEFSIAEQETLLITPAPLLPFWEKGLGDEGKCNPPRPNSLTISGDEFFNFADSVEL